MLADSAWPVFWATIAGGAIAAISTFLGTIYVERIKLAREARIRMHDELLPALDAADHTPGFAYKGPPVSEIHAALRRAAVLARHRERELVKDVQEAYGEQQLHGNQFMERPTDEKTPEAVQRYNDEHETRHEAVQAAVAALNAHLEKKLR